VTGDYSPASGMREVIPLANPGARFRAQKPAIEEAFKRVVASGRYVLGPEVEAFERELAAFVGVEHCVGVASGTDAITLALGALGVGPGDEVLTVAHSAVATVAAIELAGADAVLVDIDPERRTLDPDALGAAVTERCKAVVVVHIYGQPADLGRITALCRDRGLRLVEDCAQAHGAAYAGSQVGSFGDAAAFSFYPTKNLGAIGDGGAVTTRSAAVAERVRALRQYGWDEARVAREPGRNSRLDELQAAFLRVGLTGLCQDVERRRAIAARYDEALAGTSIRPPARLGDSEHAYHLYVVEHAARDALADALRQLGVATGRHYSIPIHHEPAYRGRLRGAAALPRTEQLYRHILSLPMFPELSDTQVEHVCRALCQCGAGR
jgi:dTDP-4-amino-4,6-dideoxygalactose transaminase